MNPNWIGWAASIVLVATLARQIIKQSNAPEDGVSHWLFIGQCVASIGFVIYSVLVGNWVFIVTNSCILLTALIGQLRLGRSGRKASNE